MRNSNDELAIALYKLIVEDGHSLDEIKADIIGIAKENNLMKSNEKKFNTSFNAAFLKKYKSEMAKHLESFSMLATLNKQNFFFEVVNSGSPNPKKRKATTIEASSSDEDIDDEDHHPSPLPFIKQPKQDAKRAARSSVSNGKSDAAKAASSSSLASRKKFASSKKEAKDSASSSHDLETIKQQLEAKISALKNEIHRTLTQEIQSKSSALEKEITARFENQLAALSQPEKLDSLNKEVNTITKQITELAISSSKSSTSILDIKKYQEASINDLESKISALKNEMERQNGETAKISEQLFQLTNGVSESATSIQAIINSHETSTKDLESKISTLKKEIEASIKEKFAKHDHSEEIERQKTEINQIRWQLSQLTVNVSAAQTTLTKATEHQQLIEKKLEDYFKKITLESIPQAQHIITNSIKTSIQNDMQIHFEKLKPKLDQYIRTQLLGQSNTFNNQIAAKELEIRQLSTTVENQNKKIETLQKEMNKLKKAQTNGPKALEKHKPRHPSLCANPAALSTDLSSTLAPRFFNGHQQAASAAATSASTDKTVQSSAPFHSLALPTTGKPPLYDELTENELEQLAKAIKAITDDIGRQTYTNDYSTAQTNGHGSPIPVLLSTSPQPAAPSQDGDHHPGAPSSYRPLNP